MREDKRKGLVEKKTKSVPMCWFHSSMEAIETARRSNATNSPDQNGRICNLQHIDCVALLLLLLLVDPVSKYLTTL